MVAIVQIAGKQFTAEKNKTLYVPNLSGVQEGSEVAFDDVLMTFKDGVISTAKGGSVKARVLKHVKGDKVIAFKMKRRKGFRKKKGHRTHYTQIKIDDIISH